MNFPALETFGCRKRLSSFNRVLKDLFRPWVNKVGLRLDLTAYPWLETNLESMYERTLRWINRDNSAKGFLDAVERMKPRKLCLFTRLMVCFPSETYLAITVAPQWSVDPRGMRKAIGKTLEARNAWRGKRIADTSMSVAFDHPQGASL